MVILGCQQTKIKVTQKNCLRVEVVGSPNVVDLKMVVLVDVFVVVVVPINIGKECCKGYGNVKY